MRIQRWKARRTVSKWSERNRRRRQRERIEAGEPETIYEGLLAVWYELRALLGVIRAFIPGVNGGEGGILSGASDVVEAVDDAAGAMNLDGESQQFERETAVETEAEAELELETEAGFDPWEAGAQQKEEDSWL